MKHRSIIIVVIMGLCLSAGLDQSIMGYVAQASVDGAADHLPPKPNDLSPQPYMANLAGRVLSQETRRAIAHARITVQHLGLTTYSDAQGQFALPAIRLPATSYAYPVTITVAANGYGDWTISNVRLIVSDTLILDVPLQREATHIAMPDPIPVARMAVTSVDLTHAPHQMLDASDTTPPLLIRVRVTGQAGCSLSTPYQVQTVRFDDYARHVLPNEWIASWPVESLRAGAMAVKTYAWYWVNRGGKWSDADVYDSTCDQVYNPAVSYASTNRAVDDTWGQRMLSSGHIFQVHYCAHAVNCVGGMGQWESRDMAAQGMSWQDILRSFYTGIDITDTVMGPPLAAFEHSSPDWLGQVSLFDNTSVIPFGSSVVTYTWDFGDGAGMQQETLSPITHTYTAAGSYTVTLTVTNQAGSSQASQPMTIFGQLWNAYLPDVQR